MNTGARLEGDCIAQAIWLDICRMVELSFWAEWIIK
jgi:hypothetical protein